VIWGRTDWILLVTKTSFTREVMRLDFPVPSSPQTQILTRDDKLLPVHCGGDSYLPVAIADGVSASQGAAIDRPSPQKGKEDFRDHSALSRGLSIRWYSWH
jgi:hypothetical protein